MSPLPHARAMGSRLDAKQEKKIKELLRLPDNRRCVNCDSLVRNALCSAENGGRHWVSEGPMPSNLVPLAHASAPHSARRAPSMSCPTLMSLCARPAAVSSE